jgi:hypothetical protein
MRTEIDHITGKLETMESNQETAAQETVEMQGKLDTLGLQCHEIRQLAGAR